MSEANILTELIVDLPKYRAHKRSIKKECEYETLLAHTDLTLSYFKRIWQEKSIDNFMEEFTAKVMPKLSKDGKIFLYKMIWGIPVFHDIGKINPRFQQDKMDNHDIKKIEALWGIGTIHSQLSAILYIDYFRSEIRKNVSAFSDRKILNIFLFYHAYIISRHHSNLSNMEEFLQILEDKSSESIFSFFNGNNDESLKEVYKGKFNLKTKVLSGRIKSVREWRGSLNQENGMYMYIYEKMMYSLLVASDYYATTDFMNDVSMQNFGGLKNVQEWIDIYEKTPMMKSVRAYQQRKFPQSIDDLKKIEDINELRCEIFCETEKELQKHRENNLFYLEAPTGSGKSNTAINLCFNLMKSDEKLQKIYYIYPFNTLVEQNLECLQNIFGNNADKMKDIAVINSLTAIKVNEEESNYADKWSKALLDRQFLNYPMIVSTHVSFFDTIFGCTKESAFGFYQLMNSVVVLDEIQSYRNTLWGKFSYFVKAIAKLLHMKVIIMSATLPNLDLLSDESYKADILLPDRKKYFTNRCFKDRVHISYELLEKTKNEDAECSLELLQQHLIDHIGNEDRPNKILVEFIKKTTAYNFWQRLNESPDLNCDLEYMSGDSNLIERKQIIDKFKTTKKSIILVATQVIEAGVDIDADLGYKDISRLDSEEQFMGRINRSCKRSGKVYFFNVDNCRFIYRNDIRADKTLTLENESIRDILLKKDFSRYYAEVMNLLKDDDENLGEDGLEKFFQEISELRWKEITEKMKLINDDEMSISVYLAREIKKDDGTIINGKDVWHDYISLLKNQKMNYAEKQVKLSQIKAKMGNFIYKIHNSNLVYDDRCGELLYIEDGEKFFDGNKFNRARIEGRVNDFIDIV